MNLELIGTGGLDSVDPFFMLIFILVAIPTSALLIAGLLIRVDYVHKRYFSRAASNFVESLAVNHSRHRIYNPAAVDLEFRRCYMETWSDETNRIDLEYIGPPLLSSGNKICKQP